MKTKNAVNFSNGSPARSTCFWARLGSLALLSLALTWAHGLNAATLTTDQSDYSPFTLVSITGTGFQAGETINNQIVQVAGPAPGTVYAPWTAQADTKGNFTTSWMVFSDDLIGTTLQLTSTGQSSGLSASTTFSDSLTCPGLQTGVAPINPPSGGFGIDGDLIANTPTPGVGDWLPNAVGLGGVLDASGCPLNSLSTLHLLDPANSGADNNFSSGKANDNPNNWTWVTGPVGNKVDLKHALIHIAKDGNGHTWIVVAATRESNNGDAYVDFEFLQNSLTLVTNANGQGGFSSAGPNGGRTINDFVLGITLTGGGTTPNLCVFRWNQVGVDNLGNPQYDYTNATSALPANSVFGAMNTATVSIPNCYSNVVDSYGVNQFAEVAVDLTAMISNFDPCATASIGTLFVKSKQSQSPSAQLGDFIAPQPLYQPFVIGPAAFAGPNQAKCPQASSTSFTLAGSVQQGSFPLSSTNWAAVSGFATIDNPASLTPTVTIFGTGTNVTMRLTVKDSGACANSTQHSDVVLSVNPVPSVTVNSPSTCAGNPATIQASVSSGTGPFAYAWMVPATATTPGNVDHFSATVAGSYSVVVTDANGCASTSASGTLTVNPNPTVTVNSPTTCAGSGAIIQASITGGTGPFAYSWTVPVTVSDPGNIDHFTATVAGSYSVVVTDANGCSSTSAFGTLAVNPTPSVTVNSPATCAGSGATIQASVSGGTGPFAYAWTVPATANNPGNIDHFSATVAGLYSVVVMDVNGCTSTSASGTLTVNPNPSVTVNSPTTCSGTAATIQATVTGGAGPFVYVWTVPATVNDPGNVDHFNATVPGSYSVLVTGSQGCSSASSSGTLTVNPTPSVTVNSPSTCAGIGAAIQASVTGGTGPFAYVWTVPATASNPGSTDHFTATVAGTYSVVVTDSKSCSSASASGTLTVNPTPSVTVNSPTTCAGIGATLQASVSGGTAPFAYAWTVPATASNPGNVDHFTANVAGTYSVVVTDSKSCSSASASGTLTVNPTPSVTVNSPTTCAGNAATIQASVSGGTGPFAYAWTVPATANNPGNIDHFSATVAGIYSVVVTDSKSCSSASASGTLTVNPTPSVTVNSPTTCASSAATIQATVSSGTGPFAYTWTVPATVSDPGSVDHFSASVAGTYSVVVTDSKSCSSASASGTLTVNPTPSVTVNSPTTCAGNAATIQASVSSGTGSFTYSWTVPATASNPGNVDHFSASVAGSYSVVVTDSKSCSSASASGTLTVNPTPSVSVNSPTTCTGIAATIQATVSSGTGPFAYVWTVPANVSNPGNVDHFSASLAGSYSVVVTDSKSCGSASATGTLTVNPTPSVTVNSATTCAGTSVTIQATVNSGTAPFSYAWTVPAGASNPGNVDHFNATVAGTYSVVVTDTKSCSSTTGAGMLTVNSAPIVSATVTQPACSGNTGSIIASASGGTAPYTYSVDGITFQTPGTFSALPPNTYTVTAKDANGCMGTKVVSIIAPSAITLIATPTQPMCSSQTGTINASATGGTGTFTYSKDGVNFQVSGSFSGLSASAYTVTAKDGNGCMASMPVTINAAPVPMTLSLATVQPLCSTDTGSITASTSGGTPGYTYSKDGVKFQTSGSFTGLSAGPCTITVKDANGCTCAQAATIVAPSAVSCAISGLSDVKVSSTGNTITASARGGTAPYTFDWSCNNYGWTMTGTTCNSQASTISYNAPAGNDSATFTVKTTDANGCTAVCTMTVSCSPPSFVTDSSLCTFTSPFRLIYTQDPTAMPCYKLTASNPGQFYYNMSYLGAGERTVTFYITVPYPFVTQGAQPIHAYDSLTIQNSGAQTCLTPGNPIYVSSDQVTLASYGPNPVVGVTTYTFHETVPLSSLGYVYLNIHLNYGLKKFGSYAPGGTSGNDAVGCAGSSVIPIPDLQAHNLFYNFGYTVGNVTVSTLPGVQSANDFGNNPGKKGTNQPAPMAVSSSTAE